mmetsp:Transcript_140122/g.390646  ORF Transcript_140122/g.390646 Transcript_140122/m.390646 type:complete len:700 (+) Transcript_140122:51-2150(+)|eukprot:CAMPEP_0179015808 /NCGR_PEP_ID=MMETSP0796-20121207/2988_1 /TAXON_ID=73915 /ORGANISM="Pyrodinium bahamense, Strain pbaha01" /LENGTH=699 /DNA_ID=CAMNT_0020711465 /DNA_START=43 /DNA_END=2142 /DNA_ORIENTATION=-
MLKKEEELVEWLTKQNLDRHKDKLMDIDGDVGLTCLDDLREASEEDLQHMGEAVNMNMMEQKRFLRGVKSLRSPNVQEKLLGEQDADRKAPMKPGQVDKAQADEQAMAPAELNAAIEVEAQDTDQYEVVMSDICVRKAASNDAPSVGVLPQNHVLHALKERVLDSDGQVWAELTPVELRRCCQPGMQTARGFVLIDDRLHGGGLQLQGPLGREAAPLKQGDGATHVSVPSDELEELEASLIAFAEVPEHADLFEVVKSHVSVHTAPQLDSPQIGTLKKPHVVHVKHETHHDETGRSWVELTNLEVWRSCEPNDANDRGFVLIDGTHLGQGFALKGPLPRSGATEWLNAHTKGKRIEVAKLRPAAKAALQSGPTVFARIQEYANLFEVEKSLVFVKPSPDKDAKNIGCLKLGQTIQAFVGTVSDTSGQAWVELTSYEMWHSCKRFDRGFVLIDGTHLKLGKLLRGPLSDEERKAWQARQAKEHVADLCQKQAERAERKRDAEEYKKKMMKESPDAGKLVPTHLAVRDTVHIKWSEDPRHKWITASSCQPGTCFYSTGMEWSGPNQETWVQGCPVDGKPRWLLVQDPLSLGGPFLVEHTDAENHVVLNVHYMTVRCQNVFETSIDRNASVKDLKRRFCTELNLNPDLVKLKAKYKGLSNVQPLSEALSLSVQSVTSDTHLFAEYDADLFQSVMFGRALGWL